MTSKYKFHNFIQSKLSLTIAKEYRNGSGFSQLNQMGNMDINKFYAGILKETDWSFLCTLVHQEVLLT